MSLEMLFAGLRDRCPGMEIHIKLDPDAVRLRAGLRDKEGRPITDAEGDQCVFVTHAPHAGDALSRLGIYLSMVGDDLDTAAAFERMGAVTKGERIPEEKRAKPAAAAEEPAPAEKGRSQTKPAKTKKR